MCVASSLGRRTNLEEGDEGENFPPGMAAEGGEKKGEDGGIFEALKRAQNRPLF